ncbi:MAG: hypothetical protein AAFV95_25465 [Bacteroidota bacterium]
MKNVALLFLCTLFLSSGLLAQPGSYRSGKKKCPDMAVTQLYAQTVIIDPPPANNPVQYSIWAIVKNVGTQSLSPKPSGYSAFLYAKTKSGWKLLKRYPLPSMNPGQEYPLSYQLPLASVTKVPSIMIRLMPSVRGARNPDCNLRNNVRYHRARPLSGPTGLQARGN